MSNYKFGVIGAGVMGTGVALNLAIYGYDVFIYDHCNEKINRLDEELKKLYRELVLLRADLKVKEFNGLNIHKTTSISELRHCNFIVENIIEDKAAKQELYLQLSKYLTNETIVAINTSCISITEIGNHCPYPENVIGMHFMNPVPLKKFVEIVKGSRTADKTIQIAQDILRTINKSWVVVNDVAGFVSNRLSHLLMNEAAFLVYEGIASPRDIDKVFRLGYGHEMGPLETADLIGLDTVVNSLHVLYEYFQDPKFRCCPLLRQKVSSGELGMKSGKGFFDYSL